MNQKQNKLRIPKKEKISFKRIQILILTIMFILSSIMILLNTTSVADEICKVPIDYPTIQYALDDPTCSIIEVLPGTYEESLSINRSVVLYAPKGPDATMLDVPDGSMGIKVQASDVLVRGFKIEGGTTGIYVAPDPLGGDTLLNISLEWLKILFSSDNGLEISNVTGLTVMDSVFVENGVAAIISDSEELIFTTNLMENHDVAWYLTQVNNSVIRQNLISGTGGIYLIGGCVNIFEENIMELESFSIRLEQNPLTELNKIKKNIVKATSTGGTAVDIIEADGNLVNDNVITGPWNTGLSFIKVSTGDFNGNVICGSSTGVLIDQGDDLVFEGNAIIDGASYGIRVHEADSVDIRGNVIVGSNLGIATTGEVLDLHVDGNVFSENEVGVMVEGLASTASVNHNVVDSNILGVNFTNINNGEITYNIITENTNAGIQLRECDNLLIAHNEVVVGGLTGIRILDSGSSPENLIVEWNNVSTEAPQPSIGPGPEYRLYGIEIRRSNITVQDNLIEDIVHEEGFEELDSGYGVYVKASGDVHILRNTVDGYQKYGILAEELPSYVLPAGDIQDILIKNNTVLGLGVAFSPPQTGIMIRNGANASLEDNFVGYNWYEGTDDVALGIGVFDAPHGVDILRNRVEENQYGIYISGFDNSLIESNLAIRNTQGIRVKEADETIVTLNELEGLNTTGFTGILPIIGINITDSSFVEVVSNIACNHQIGIEAKTSNDILIKWNDITYCDVVGIHLLGGMNSLVGDNYVSLSEDGVLLEESVIYASVTNNLIEDNKRGIIVNESYVTDITWNEIRNGLDVGILIKNDGATHVYRNTITNHGTGIESIGSEAVYIDKNDVQGNEIGGIYLESSSGSGIVRRNELWRNGFGLFATGYGNDFVVTHNNIEENGVGVKVEGKPDCVSIEVNQIARNSAQGVYIGPTGNGNTIFNNVIKFNDGTGIKVEGSGNSVNRNVVNNNNNYGIWVTGDYNLFTRNVIKSNFPYNVKDEGKGNKWIQNQIGTWDLDP